MGAMIYWTLRLVTAFLGVVLWGISARATITIYAALFFEFSGFLWMTFPFSSVASAIELFLGVGLILGVLLSFGRERPALWKLPALAAGILIVLRASVVLQADWPDVRATLPMHLAMVFGFPAGMLAGGAVGEGAARVWAARRKRVG
jgi:hypothetical protein